eukprot:841786-Pelagomonas_calceolata.AAC.2
MAQITRKQFLNNTLRAKWIALSMNTHSHAPHERCGQHKQGLNTGMMKDTTRTPVQVGASQVMLLSYASDVKWCKQLTRRVTIKPGLTPAAPEKGFLLHSIQPTCHHRIHSRWKQHTPPGKNGWHAKQGGLGGPATSPAALQSCMQHAHMAA